MFGGCMYSLDSLVGAIRMLLFPVCWDDKNVYIYIYIYIYIYSYHPIYIYTHIHIYVVPLLVELTKHIGTIFVERTELSTRLDGSNTQ